jgi:hypothetical protein
MKAVLFISTDEIIVCTEDTEKETLRMYFSKEQATGRNIDDYERQASNNFSIEAKLTVTGRTDSHEVRSS